jgi:hypothetical protein
MRTAFCLCLFLAMASASGAASERFTSGPAQVPLIELFTSEGCSSCPPAEAWLGGLAASTGLWTDFVPLQFHVDYWDELGWRDLLATREFTARQYAYASSWGATNVYTPCFVRNGREWKPSLGLSAGPAVSTGILILERGAGGVWSVSFTPGPGARASADGLLEAHLAYLGSGVSSRVTAGENSGATLTHEFAVLGLANQILARDGPGGKLRATLGPARSVTVPCPRHAIAAWVTARGGLEPIQAVGGWLAD